jgi:hypothetical protein
LDEICRTIGRTVEHLMRLQPSAYGHLEHDIYEDTIDSAWAKPVL